MKKYIIAVLILFIPCVTYALTMCARDNGLVISLNANISGNSAGVNNSEFTWAVKYDYGTVLGEGTCLSGNEAEQSLDNIQKGLHGYDNTSTARTLCYCRLTHPALSRWKYSTRFTSLSDCRGNCASYCARNASAGDTSLRVAMFNSIGK